MKRGPKPKKYRREKETARLEAEINATVDLVSRHIVALSPQQQEALRHSLWKLATVAAALTILPASEQEALKSLCNEVLTLAEGEAVVSYADELRAKVRASTLGEQVYRARYPELDQAGVSGEE